MFDGMRDHSTIVREHGPASIARVMTATGVHVSVAAAQRWGERDSIPGEYWACLAEAGIATLEELAAAAHARRITDREAA